MDSKNFIYWYILVNKDMEKSNVKTLIPKDENEGKNGTAE